MRRAPKKPPACGLCGGPPRSTAEIAQELREFPAFWRALGVEGWAESKWALDEHGAVQFGDYHSASGASQLAVTADVALPALALELEGKFCRWCSHEVAEGTAHRTKLVFIALLKSLMPSGRDERAEEEFELQAVAA